MYDSRWHFYDRDAFRRGDIFGYAPNKRYIVKATVRTPDEVNELMAKATVTPNDIALITKLMADTISYLLLRVSVFFWRWGEIKFRIAIGYHVAKKKVAFFAYHDHDRERANTSYHYHGPFTNTDPLLEEIDTTDTGNVEESEAKFEEYWGEGNEHKSEFRVTEGKEYVLYHEGVETRGDFEKSKDAFEQFIEEKLLKLPEEDRYTEDAKSSKLPLVKTVSGLEYVLVHRRVEPQKEYERWLARSRKDEDVKPRKRKLSEEDTADEDKRVSHNNSLYAFDKRIDAFWDLPEEDTSDEDGEEKGPHP